MEVIIENIIAYSAILLIVGSVIIFYLRNNAKKYKTTSEKIQKAKEFGFHEPVSLHPVVDVETCIGSGACVAACPEKDVLGIVHGHAATINASRCVGHGACFHACPMQAITLCIGTEERGVELPHISQQFETNIPGIFIAGELGGMGLIKNAVEQGRQAVEYFKKKINIFPPAEYDLVIIGAGPAGISASLTAVQNNLKFVTLEQDTLGGTVYTFPRSKIVMTAPMNLPLHGKVKLFETSKMELLELWEKVLNKNSIKINEEEKVISVEKINGNFKVISTKSEYTAKGIILAIGRRGSPRKLGVEGESKEKVAYRLLEPENINGKKIMVVGGGDSAVEAALLLSAEGNHVTLSYRKEVFSRLKPKNLARINNAIDSKKIAVIFKSEVKKIKDNSIDLILKEENKILEIENDLIYIFAGGELPTKFLEKIGIHITKKFGDPVLKHNN